MSQQRAVTEGVPERSARRFPQNQQRSASFGTGGGATWQSAALVLGCYFACVLHRTLPAASFYSTYPETSDLAQAHPAAAALVFSLIFTSGFCAAVLTAFALLRTCDRCGRAFRGI